MRLPIAAALAALAGAPAPAQDGPLELQPLLFPVDCTLGVTCHIQSYVDRDPGDGVDDYRCGTLSYDGHQGTDIRLVDAGDLERGVAVRAMADGTVTALRDGVPDTGAEAMAAGQDCGNGLRLDHGGGWETQYCHLAQGSLAVAEGDTVLAGDRLGAIGFSGRTEFPHLHVSVRSFGEIVDPFAPGTDRDCDAPPGVSLWAEPAPYAPGGFLSAGFAEEVPGYEAVQSGTAGVAALPATAPALVVWGYYFGNRADDLLQMTLTAPDGSVVLEEALRLGRRQAQAFRALGAARPGGGWAPGVYRGRLALSRGGAEIDAIVTTLSVRPGE